MYRIAVLTEQETQGARLEEQISRFCKEKKLFPQIEQYQNQEEFFEIVAKDGFRNAVISLPGVAGLNAVEHLRTLCPACRIIWCSDLDFSLHAFRLRVDYFLLEPVTEETFWQGLCVWLERKAPVVQIQSDGKEHNKEDY
ncbi:uncharacterized protein BN699_00191 [Firmicutes bacterium CAG:534]|nr:uncharacterized protein BN699_00191 [Firmicutes bacterium CAG:534]